MLRYAHSNGPDKDYWQSIKDHLTNTAILARRFSEENPCSDFACLAALLHDIGKYSEAFQRKLAGAYVRVDHSTAGAQEILALCGKTPSQKAITTVIAYCIAGHHSGLPDYGSVIDVESNTTLCGRWKKNIPSDYKDYAQDIDSTQLRFPSQFPIKPIEKYHGVSLAFFTRMVYSTLVDADFQETETFMNQGAKPRGGYASISELEKDLEKFLEKFSNPSTPINQKRTETLQNCIAKAVEKPGFFTLTVPTGGGKTFASLAFALKHAVIHNLKRIIYVIPYTSIIEQNAAEFKKCLGEENVLEHHCNFDWNPASDSSDVETCDGTTTTAIGKLKLAAENWDIPVVVTTNVQFFESLYANRSSRCRKIHNIANSVIIFDEAQMLPRDYLQPCLYAVHELVQNYGSSVVFCTATQPSLGQFLPPGDQLQELTPAPQALFEFYRRVRVQNIGKLPDADLVQRINDHSQVLCVVNTRKHARGLFDEVIDDGRFHLSTLMCPVHRQAAIAQIRANLKEGQPCRVISTQIMEAGIDVDFPVGYRALAGLDSIIQASGRVNREGKQASGDLFVFEPESLYVKRTPAYIRQGADVAQRILRNYSQDPVCMEAIQEYFKTLYDLQNEKAFDVKGILRCFEKGIPGELNFDFKAAAEKFKLIENNTSPVIIPFDDNATELLDRARFSKYPSSYSRKLQIYTVNIYEREFQALADLGLIDRYGDTYSVLNDMEQYNVDTGLKIPESDGGEAIFFDG